MRHISRPSVLVLVLSLCLLAAGAPAAFAASPANDTQATAIQIQSLPHSTTQDTADATSEPTDPTFCGQQKRTVWYSYTADQSGRLVVSAAGSSYRPVIEVQEQSGPTRTAVACADTTASGGSVGAFPVAAGNTYFFVVGESPYYNAPSVWTLKFALRVQPEIDVSLHAPAFVDTGTKAATVTGVAECSEPLTVELPVNLRQQTAAGTAYGLSTSYLDCTSDPQLFSVKVPNRSSVGFARGKADLYGTAQVRSDKVSHDVSRSVLLKPCTQIGTVGADSIIGTSGKDRICSLHGDDTVRTQGGYDVVYSGPGEDRIELGAGGGHAYGGTGDDAIIGGSGVELVYGGAGADVINLGGSRDRAYGQAGSDRIFGGGAGDYLFGGGGADRLNGDTGSDRCVGGPKADSFTSCESRTQ